MSEIHNKYLDMKLTARGENIHDTISNALAVVKAYGSRMELEFPRGYSITIWPDSNLNDLKALEEKSLYLLAAKEVKEEFLGKLTLCRQALFDIVDLVDKDGAFNTDTYKALKEVLEKTKVA